MLVDVHTHLDNKCFLSSINQVVERAKQANISIIINNGLNHKTNLKTLELSEKYEIIKAALGIYPEFVSRVDIDKEIKFIENNKNKIIAIGEIGLDKSKNISFELQKEVFIKLLDLAKKLDKPVIVHSRKAEKEIIDILEEKKTEKVILHAFHGNLSLAKRAQSLGYNFSIPVAIVKSTHFQNLVKILNLTSLLTETDAPYLNPTKKINEPCYIIDSLKKIAELKQITLEETEKTVFMNFQNLFYSSSM